MAFGALQIFFQRFVFAVVPAIGRKLRQARAMPGHALHQIVRHRQANVGPVAIALEIIPRDGSRDQQPKEEQRRLQQPAGARRQHEDRGDDFDERHQREKAAAQRQRFHGFRFEHASQQLPRALMAEAVGIQAQRSEEEPLLQERARADGDPALQSRDQHAQRDQRQQQERPGNQPCAIRSAAQDVRANDVPCQNPEHVLKRVGAGERGSRRGMRAWRSCSPEVRAGRQAQQPDAADAFGAETFAQDGIARPSLFRGRDLRAVEHLLNLAQDGRFHVGAERGADGGGIDADFLESGVSSIEPGRSARKAGPSWRIRGWSHVAKLALEIGVGVSAGCASKPMSQRGGFDPAESQGLGIGDWRRLVASVKRLRASPKPRGWPEPRIRK